MTLVAADRLIAVVFPATYIQITVKRRRLLILCTWILAMTIHSPYFYGIEINQLFLLEMALNIYEEGFIFQKAYGIEKSEKYKNVSKLLIGAKNGSPASAWQLARSSSSVAR